MPKIATQKRQVLGQETNFEIKVDKTGRFTTSWPMIMRERCEKIEDSFPTMDELVKEIDQRVSEVNTLGTTVEWIIAYKYLGRCHWRTLSPNAKVSVVFTLYKKTTTGQEVIYHHIDYDTFGSRKDPKNHPWVKNSDGIPVENWYVAGNEWSWPKDSFNGNPLANPENDNVLPLTDENLAFFIKIAEEMRKLNDRLYEFLQPDSVKAFIQSNAQLQLTSSLGSSQEENAGTR